MKNVTICLLFSIQVFSFNCEPPKKNLDDQDLLLLALGVALVNQCNVGVSGFWTIDFFTGNDRCTSVRKVAEGNRAVIFEEVSLASRRRSRGLTDLNFATISNEIENSMLPKIYSAIGEPSDINRDGKISIVFADLSSGINTNVYIAGYFNPVDLFRSPGGGIRSNEREVIYIDGLRLIAQAEESAKRGRPNDTYSTIAHEIQHLIRYPFSIGKGDINEPISYPRTISELNSILDTDENWINEGTSEVVSDIAGYGPQWSRLACLRSDPAYGCTNSVNGRSLYQFLGRISDYSHSYAFMKFIYENSGNTLEEKNSFLRSSIRGTTSGTRAKTINTLGSVYLTNAAKYNSVILGTTNLQITGRLMSAFYANFFKYPNVGTTLAKFDLGADVDISAGGTSLLTTYSMPSSLAELTANPSFISLINNSPTAFGLEPGQIYRVSGAPAALTSATSIHLVRNAAVEYFIFNGVNNEETGYSSVSTSVQSLKSKALGFGFVKPTWSVESIEEPAGVDPQSYVNALQLWRSRNLLINNN